MIERLRNLILSLPEFRAWPQLTAAFERAGTQPRLDWELPGLACRAVGGDADRALHGAAAIACLQISIILVDDILDDDPRGEHLKIGAGRAANIGLALQATAGLLIARSGANSAEQAAAQRCLAEAALKTALGQDLDVSNLEGEAAYWRVVEHKSTPFYGAALELGAILGGAAPEVCAGLYRLGKLIGEIIQLNDDILDAFQTPANPDWLQGRNNLLILYARTAPHPHRERFLELLGRIEAPGTLAAAQQMLIASGAVSYAIFQIVQRAQQAQALIRDLPLADRAVLAGGVVPVAPALTSLLQSRGIEVDLPLVQS